MLRVYVDEAAAFDILAILYLKAQVSKHFTAYNDFADVMVEQLTSDIFVKIRNSEEYLELIQANRRVFELVDDLDAGDIELRALDVHKANMKRFYAKKSLQAKFFGNDLTEQKTVK